MSENPATIQYIDGAIMQQRHNGVGPTVLELHPFAYHGLKNDLHALEARFARGRDGFEYYDHLKIVVNSALYPDTHLGFRLR